MVLIEELNDSELEPPAPPPRPAQPPVSLSPQPAPAMAPALHEALSKELTGYLRYGRGHGLGLSAKQQWALVDTLVAQHFPASCGEVTRERILSVAHTSRHHRTGLRFETAADGTYIRATTKHDFARGVELGRAFASPLAPASAVAPDRDYHRPPPRYHGDDGLSHYDVGPRRRHVALGTRASSPTPPPPPDNNGQHGPAARSGTVLDSPPQPGERPPPPPTSPHPDSTQPTHKVASPAQLYATQCQCSDYAANVEGTYVVHGENHGRPMYKRSAGVGWDVAFLYYWDGRDHAAYTGWWLASQVGGEESFMFNTNAQASVPPECGWKATQDSITDSSFVITPQCPFEHWLDAGNDERGTHALPLIIDSEGEWF